MIIDCHVHVNGGYGSESDRMADMIRFADRVGIDKLCLSLGYSRDQQPSPEVIEGENDIVREEVERRPDRYIGMCYLNPNHLAHALGEMDRCIANGPFRGVKLWVAAPMSHPNLDPICERAAELGAPILQHTWYKITGNLPFESRPEDVAAIAARHPETTIIFGHSGGNWEWGYRVVQDLPNVHAELAGGDPELGQTEMAVAMLGAERVVYGSDAHGRSFASQMSKVYGADISEADKALILGGNMERILGL